MKRLMLILILIVMGQASAFAVTQLSSTEVQPDFDRFRITTLRISTVPELTVEIWAKFGYDDGGFVDVASRYVIISNRDIGYNGENIYRDDQDGMMLDLPAAYQENPATKNIQEIDAGTFGGQSGLVLYLEAIVKTLLNL